MATGLREELLNNKQLALDFVVGPDSYKRLPVILEALIARGPRSAVSGQPGSVSLHGSVKGEKVKGEKVKGGPYVHPSPFYPLPMSAPDTAADLPTSSSPGYDVTLSEFETYADVYPAREAGVNAWVAVMRGCNNFCSFCIVPFTRGRERSRSVANIVEEVRRLAGEGFPQVTLLGQNVNSYQHDGKDFAALLEAVAKV
ncbi:MAG: radical SAM protein, partial [Desulfobulbaceae bacterium]|nr:radical SAM protein [Desulfobulbaceae bacterium]